MATRTITYSTPTNVLSTTNLANGASYQTASVQAANTNVDILVQFSVTTATTGTATTGTVTLYVAGNNSSLGFPDGLTGTAGSYSPVSPTNAITLIILNTPSNSTTFNSEPIRIGNLFGGTVPPNVTFFVTNNSGATLASVTVSTSTVTETIV